MKEDKKKEENKKLDVIKLVILTILLIALIVVSIVLIVKRQTNDDEQDDKVLAYTLSCTLAQNVTFSQFERYGTRIFSYSSSYFSNEVCWR
jgi:flagellar basal body-associated protein FliL